MEQAVKKGEGKRTTFPPQMFCLSAGRADALHHRMKPFFLVCSGESPH